MRVARLHRVIAAVMALPFLLWTATGLLFHLKPGWDRAYEVLSIADPSRAVAAAGLRSLAGLDPRPLRSAELLSTAIGPLYRLRFSADADAGERLFDARSGVPRSPLGDADADRLLDDAVRRSAYRQSYASLQRVQRDAVAVTRHYAGGVRLRLERHGGRLQRDGADRSRIDAVYDVHYMRWTGIDAVDRALALIAIAGTWLATALGLYLLWARGRAQATVNTVTASPPSS